MTGFARHRWPSNLFAGRRRVCVALAAALVALVAADGAHAAADSDRFTKIGKAPIPVNRLFDVGVTDYNGDALLDIFTANHKFHPGLLLNSGGSFTDVAGESGFSQSPQFPGLEYLKKPRLDEDGIYLYVTDSAQHKLPSVVHVRAKDAAISGRLIFSGEGLVVERAENAEAEVDPSNGRQVVDYDIRAHGILNLRVKSIDLPFSAEFEQPQASLPPPFPQPNPVPVFIGTDAVRTTERTVLLTIRDRHGYAFADVAGDGALDGFAVSGGLGGAIGIPGFDGRIQDELLVGAGGRFVNQTPNTGIVKGVCRGRQALVADADADGLLDLFEGCEGNRPQIYRQTSRGSFTQIRSPRVIGDTYRWAELGGGSRPELLVSGGARGIQVLRLGGGGWDELQSIESNARNGRIAQFALDDIDADGDLDVLVVAGTGNTLLRNDRGRLEPVPLKRFGIPNESVAASFADYDNDGHDDLHLVPQGILAGSGRGAFTKTGMLRSRGKIGAAMTSWPDLHNDGLRDPIVATGTSVFSKRKRVQTRRNNGPAGNWLEVDVLGTPGNPQAIGARVAIGAKESRQYQWVGQNDDSHFSQGHYRTYFGLGDREGVSKLLVEWPDGAVAQLDNVTANQLLRVQHP